MDGGRPAGPRFPLPAQPNSRGNIYPIGALPCFEDFAVFSADHDRFLAAAVASPRDPVVGQPAPDFLVTAFDGRKMRLTDFKGQVLVINFWATWCAPCKQELPLLNRYYHLRQEASAGG